MSTALAVSVLDLVGMRAGESAGSAIGRSVDLAQHVEQCELQAPLAGRTSLHFRIGLLRDARSDWARRGSDKDDSGWQRRSDAAEPCTSGGGGAVWHTGGPVSGRIDLGLGRAPGSDLQTMRALRRDLRQNGEDFPALLDELRAYLGPEKPGQAVKAIPGQGSNVPIILLGSSGFSAQLAGMLGLPFAFAAHFAPEYLYVVAQLYRQHFRPSEALRKPYLIVAVQVIAAETDAAARRLFRTPQQRFLRLIRNEPVELLPPLDSMESLWQDWERAAVERKLGAAIVGSIATVKAGWRN